MKLERAKGTKDFLPEEKIVRQEIIDTIRDVFELYGFNPLETPALERFEILSSKYSGGAEILKETFKLKDQANRKLGLRYDLTVPLCRVIGMNPQLKVPFKRYEIGKVWRDGPISSVRAREFTQCDFDVIGCKSMVADAEILSILEQVFNKLGVNINIKVNNRKLLNGILDFLGIKENKRIKTILVIDKLSKIGKIDVMLELEKLGINKEITEKLLNILEIQGGNEYILGYLKQFLDNKEALEGIKELEDLFKFVKEFDLKNIKLDLSLARGLVFYTGTIFEVFDQSEKVGTSLAGGGRYDKIIGKFLGNKKEYPAVGCSFGLDRIYEISKSLGKIKEKRSLTEVYVIPIQTQEKCIEIIQKLRKNGIKSDIDLIGRGLTKNLDYANKLGIPYVIIVGFRDLESEQVTLRNMITGEEKKVNIMDIIKEFK